MSNTRSYLRPALGIASFVVVACGGATESRTTSGGATDGGTATNSTGDTASGGPTTTGPTTATSVASDTATGGSSTGTMTATDGSTSDGTATGGTTGGPECMVDADCQQSPNGPVCDNGTCVPCTPQNDVCGEGTYCEGNTCVPGCLDDSDCPQNLTCDQANKQCVGCVDDNDCGLGTVCEMGACVPGCNQQQPCQPGFACCNDECIDLLTDVDNCGACGNACSFANASAVCDNGTCTLDACDNGWENCDQNDANGCEQQGTCTCVPGSQQSCYTGPAGTENVGICKSGTQTCNAQGTGWGPCEGEVLPGVEVCANNLDDDCDAMVDEDPDQDGDGWTVCGGDCCDSQGPNCLNPELVNPGAFEVGGNMVDDDCDGTVDNPLPACDAGLPSNSGNPLDYAKAIDLCQFTVENPPDPADKKWGVIDAWLTLANGQGTPASVSRSIRDGFGTNITNRFGQRLAVLSTGHAADNAGDTNPNFAQYQDGVNTGTSSPFPPDYTSLPNAPGCPNPSSNQANNPVNLKIRIRVPTNAQSFSVDMFFFSAEYPEYVCTVFNDFFVTLLDSTGVGNPADKNIAVYDDGNNLWPVGVNILKAANGLFTQCSNGTISQCGAPSTYNGCTGTSLLNGTGFDITGSTSFSCGYSGRHGGGTGWLKMSGNVTPGEIMEIRFIIWDTSDGIFDSLVLLDNWQWSVQASDPGVTPG